MVALEDSDFAVLGDSIDLNQVAPLPVTYTISHVKQATLVIIQQLNRFSQVAEERLRQISASISRLENELTILESKLSSIPGLDSIKASAEVTSKQLAAPSNSPATASVSPVPPSGVPTAVASSPQPLAIASSPSPAPPRDVPVPETAPIVDATILTVQKDPVYSKYFKMLQVGVPAAAVKIKMQSEGLDGRLLDTPNAASPSGGAAAPMESTAAVESDDDDSEDSD